MRPTAENSNHRSSGTLNLQTVLSLAQFIVFVRRLRQRLLRGPRVIERLASSAGDGTPSRQPTRTARKGRRTRA